MAQRDMNIGLQVASEHELILHVVISEQLLKPGANLDGLFDLVPQIMRRMLNSQHVVRVRCADQHIDGHLRIIRMFALEVPEFVSVSHQTWAATNGLIDTVHALVLVQCKPVEMSVGINSDSEWGRSLRSRNLSENVVNGLMLSDMDQVRTTYRFGSPVQLELGL